MTEMIERVASAMWMRDKSRPEGSPPKNEKELYDDLAKAAIEGMMEPSQSVLDCRPPFMTVQDARAMWRTMIDAALRS